MTVDWLRKRNVIYANCVNIDNKKIDTIPFSSIWSPSSGEYGAKLMKKRYEKR